MPEKKTLKAYVAYTLELGNRMETRFCCIPCDEVRDAGNMFEVWKDGHIVGQFDRGAVDIFYYTEAAR